MNKKRDSFSNFFNSNRNSDKNTYIDKNSDKNESIDKNKYNNVSTRLII